MVEAGRHTYMPRWHINALWPDGRRAHEPHEAHWPPAVLSQSAQNGLITFHYLALWPAEQPPGCRCAESNSEKLFFLRNKILSLSNLQDSGTQLRSQDMRNRLKDMGCVRFFSSS